MNNYWRIIALQYYSISFCELRKSLLCGSGVVCITAFIIMLFAWNFDTSAQFFKARTNDLVMPGTNGNVKPYQKVYTSSK